jgi:hypothetical protein
MSRPASFGAACLLALAAPALAQQGAKRGSTAAQAVDAITSPLSDLNLRGKAIPAVLLRAQTQPYDLSSVPDCEAVRSEIARLERVLGPDADTPADGAGVVGSGLKAGGNMLSGMIPFGGLVRQFSGANARRTEWKSAVYAGVARRSYLKGYGKGLACVTVQEQAVQSAKDVLGMGTAKAD